MVTYKPDDHATGNWLRTSPDLQRVCLVVAGNIADYAKAIAPVESGDYRSKIETRKHPGWDGRVGAAVAATADHSAAVEFGNARVKAQAPLARAAAMMEAYQ